MVIASGGCGALLGLGCRWQTAVESAQVLAGVVEYAPHNPFYLYHVKTWTLLHQLPAAALALGWEESTLCVLLGALAGGLTFVAISLIALALSAPRWLAMLAPLCMLSAATYLETGGVYPLRMLSERTWAIYGVVGAGWTLLSWALFALGKWRCAGLALGLAPAVHPLLGAWCLAIAAATALLFWRHLLMDGGRLARWLTAGLLLSAISFVVQLSWTSGLPTIPSEEASRYVAAYINGWDTHRRPYPLGDAAILVASVAAVLCVVAVRSTLWQGTTEGPSSRDVSERTMSILLGISTLGAIVLCVATHFPNQLPASVMACMPGRFINLTVLVFPVAVWALVGRLCPPWIALPLLILLAGVCGAKVLWDASFPAATATWPWFVGVAAIASCCGLRAQGRAAGIGPDGTVMQNGWVRGATIACFALLGLPAMGVGATVVVMGWFGLFHAPAQLPLRGVGLAAAVAAWALLAGHQVRTSLAEMNDWRSDPFYAAIHAGEGSVAIVAGVSSTQLLSRRPVLLEVSSLNQLPYVPESGPEMNRILQAVYGEDLFAGGPGGGKRRPGLDPQGARELWESRDLGEWQVLASEFGFRQVMAHDGWQLQLPTAAKSRKFTLYHIPESTGNIHE